jgi:hypothetical protein
VLRGATAAVLVTTCAYGQWLAGMGRPGVLWLVPYRVTPAAVAHPRIASILRTHGGPVLYLPVLGTDRHAVQAQAMFESIGRWQPVLNGYGGFYPAAFPARMALAGRLPDIAALQELVRSTGVELVVVRGTLLSRTDRERWEVVAQQRGSRGFRLVAVDGSDMLFSVTPSDGTPQ